MFYGSASFRKSAFALTTIAALTAFASFSAAAQQLADNARTDACASIIDGAKQAQCRIDAIDRDTEAKNRQIEEMKKKEQAAVAQLHAEDRLKSCLLDLAAFKAKSPEGFAKLGTITRDNACATAARIPKPINLTNN